MTEFHGRVMPTGKVTWDFPAQLVAFLRHLYAKTGDGAISASFYPLRSKRSDRQNKALWSLLAEWCREADQGWRPDELKDVMLGRVFGTVERVVPLTGEVVLVNVEPHTSTLSVTQFCALIEAVLELAATSEPPVFLSSPDEYRRAKAAAQKAAHKAAAKAAR